ncbi:MAG: NAD(P)/FAD-dependent oxidoreductase [Acetobacterium sp.]|nr:NAD(P)/FAD-dependent oxidoreductase [Bacillota bacterium]MCG2730555.1 NAD(P)/FAD-dependent oxidoreductase [Acetobacterium sp.]
MKQTDVIVIGGGPAGLAAALAAHRAGARTLLIEREPRLGGILKQCIHDGFGLVRFSEQLTGPEYADRDITSFKQAGIEALTTTFVTRIKKTAAGFILTAVNETGVLTITAKALVLATGCRERTARQVFIHGTRPAGIFTAGTAQHYINLLGQMPAKKCVILGSGDIGLIMARRLTLEGATVLGVYEAKPIPSGLTRNIYQCLHDFDIPLHLSQTVTRVYGEERLTAVEVCMVDENMQPIAGTSQKIDCDALILSVGLIPENELAVSLGVELDPKTKGPLCNGALMTSVDGVFSCGNALHVNDLVDYVSESGELAGTSAANFSCKQRAEIALTADANFAYLVPQRLDLNETDTKTIVYFRSQRILENCDVIITVNEQEVLRKHYSHLRPPEMERLEVDFAPLNLTTNSILSFKMEVR